MECPNCKHFEPGTSGDMIQDGSCPSCGQPYREQPDPIHSEMEMRNMPEPGGNDMGGNPLQEGILADNGWQHRQKRDESFASVGSTLDMTPHLPWAYAAEEPEFQLEQVTPPGGHTVEAMPYPRAGIHNSPASLLQAMKVNVDGEPASMDLARTHTPVNPDWDSQTPVTLSHPSPNVLEAAKHLVETGEGPEALRNFPEAVRDTFAPHTGVIDAPNGITDNLHKGLGVFNAYAGNDELLPYGGPQIDRLAKGQHERIRHDHKGGPLQVGVDDPKKLHLLQELANTDDPSGIVNYLQNREASAHAARIARSPELQEVLEKNRRGEIDANELGRQMADILSRPLPGGEETQRRQEQGEDLPQEHQLGWQPGTEGRGLLMKDHGDNEWLYTWPVNRTPEDPQGGEMHSEHINRFNHNGFENGFDIGADGAIISGHQDPEMFNRVEQADPRLKSPQGTKSEWNFESKVALLGIPGTPSTKDVGNSVLNAGGDAVNYLKPGGGLDKSNPIGQFAIKHPVETALTAAAVAAAIPTGGTSLAAAGSLEGGAAIAGGEAAAEGGAAVAGGEGAGSAGGLRGFAQKAKGMLGKGGGRFGDAMLLNGLMGGGGGGGGAQAQPGPTDGGMGRGLQNVTHKQGDYESPSSVPERGTSDDPEKVDPHEINVGSEHEHLYDPTVNGIGGTDEGMDHAAFMIGHNMPKVLHHYFSEEPGDKDPGMQQLHKLLEEREPGYLNRPNDPSELKELDEYFDRASDMLDHFIDKSDHKEHKSKTAGGLIGLGLGAAKSLMRGGIGKGVSAEAAAAGGAEGASGLNSLKNAYLLHEGIQHAVPALQGAAQTAAPFAAMIPGVGPYVSMGLGMLGGSGGQAAGPPAPSTMAQQPTEIYDPTPSTTARTAYLPNGVNPTNAQMYPQQQQQAPGMPGAPGPTSTNPGQAMPSQTCPSCGGAIPAGEATCPNCAQRFTAPGDIAPIAKTATTAAEVPEGATIQIHGDSTYTDCSYNKYGALCGRRVYKNGNGMGAPQEIFNPNNYDLSEVEVELVEAPPDTKTAAGTASCPTCGYELSGDEGVICPHCHQPIIGTPSMNHPQTPPPVQPVTVVSADHQGPHNNQQFAIVAELLSEEQRAEEIPTMLKEPWNYADELAKAQAKIDQPPIDETQQDSPPQPAQESAPPEATMPVPGMEAPQGQMMAAVNRYSADSITPRCPKCHSGTTGMATEDGVGHCHACGNDWDTKAKKMVEGFTYIAEHHDHGELHQDPNVIDAPAADQRQQEDVSQEQDTSLQWKDASNEPLRVGQEYQMSSEHYDIPDIIRIEAVKPDSIEYTLTGMHGLEHRTELTRQEAEIEDLTFTPNDGEPDTDPDTENMDDHERVSPGETSDLSTPHQMVGKTANPMQPAIDALIQAGHSPEDAQRLVSGQGAAMNVVPQPPVGPTASTEEAREQARAELLGFDSVTAGRSYTPMEQRDFIDEQGLARNSDKLNLTNTHYNEPDEELESFLFGL